MRKGYWSIGTIMINSRYRLLDVDSNMWQRQRSTSIFKTSLVSCCDAAMFTILRWILNHDCYVVDKSSASFGNVGVCDSQNVRLFCTFCYSVSPRYVSVQKPHNCDVIGETGP